MLWTLVLVFVVLWAVGFVSGTLGGLIHILLLIALIAAIAQFVTGRGL